jgi:two-component system chemotaxis sensor kinase CheA
MDVRQYADLFLSESRDHLTAYNHLLLEWEKDPAARESVGGIFRAVHTIKGMAATMGYAPVAELSHRIENLLDGLRKGDRTATPQVLDLLLRAGDALEKGISEAVDGKNVAAPGALLAELDTAAGSGARSPGSGPRDSGFVPFGTNTGEFPIPDAGPRAPGVGRQVRVALRAEASLKGARALIALRKVGDLGVVSALAPAAAAIEAEGFDGYFNFRIETDADPGRIEQALRSAGDVEVVEIQADEAEAPAHVEAVRGKHLRVDLRRLDALMNEIGELAIARGRLATLTAQRDDPALDDVALQIGRLTQSLQAEIIAARMTPVWQVFDRFPRMVRDLARQMEKQIDFRVEGKEIELDRAILDEIGEPLVHLLRNAVDHGIESPAERLAKGKPAAGRLIVAAVRERSSVAIRVTDDGRGVDRARVLAKGKEQGLVAEDATSLPDDDIYRLLMRAGFSTAKQITDISGRGVGIDVVATVVRALGGSLEIRSEEGKGTTFTLRLPVTLAIMRALLAKAGDEMYAMPLTHVAETLDPRPSDIQTVQGKEAILLRGRLLPLIRLGELVGTPTQTLSRVPVIVIELGERRTGVIVDALVGQQEIVVKSFEAPRGMLPVFSGATILGDGKPALILDAAGLT